MPASRAPIPLFVLRSLVMAAATAAGLAFSGCSGSRHIHESQLSIVPTEATTSFSRSSQGAIAELGLTPDLLGNPRDLQRNTALSAATPSARALVISESWYLRGQNDLDVPITTSLDRYLRAAHYAYDALFADNTCGASHQPICEDLLSAYNRAVREVARVTNNGAVIPASDGTTYGLERDASSEEVNLTEWELTLDDLPSTHASSSFGSSGAGCQVVEANGAPNGLYLRRCTPIAFVVTFAQRADDGPSRAALSVHATLSKRTLSLHDTEVPLPLDCAGSWAQLLAPSTTHTIEAGCLAPVEASLPTLILSLPHSPTDLNWAAIASTLSSDTSLHDRFNFCVFTPGQTGTAGGGLQRISTALDALVATAPPHPTIVLVAQGVQSEDLLRGVKEELRAQRGPGSTQALTLAGSLVIPTPHHGSQTEVVHQIQIADLSKRDQGVLNDIKRLLTRLSDSDDGVLGAARRSSVSLTPGMNLSPVM